MMMEAENYYDVLGIRPGADDEQVKHAYRELAKTLHPDRNPGNEIAERRFKLVSTAYEALKDAGRRQSYNEFLSFNEGRQKSEKRQWGRLIALVALLLLGPSAVVVGVFGYGSGTLFGGLKTAETPTQSSPPLTEIEPPAAITQIESAEPQQAEAPPPALEEEAEAKGATGDSEPVKAPAAGKELVKEAEPADDPPEASTVLRPVEAQPNRETEAARTDPVDSNPATTSEPPVAKAAPDANAPDFEPGSSTEATLANDAPAQDDPATPDASSEETASVKPAPAPTPRIDEPIPPIAPEYTNAVPEDVEQQAPDSALADDESPGIALPVRRPQDGGSRADETAIESARRLAQLKEPETAAPLSEQDVAAVPSANADVFSDCSACPRMFIAPRSDSAVSLSEITVGQWNSCVEDGVCAPYRRFGGDRNARVVGLNAVNASAYTEWLTALTGQNYRVVMTRKPRPNGEGQPSGAPVNCEPESARGGREEWQWLEENDARQKCPPGSAAVAPQAVEGGFRVSRSVGRQG